MSNDGSGFIFILGFIVGAGGILFMGLTMKLGMRRNLKEYLARLPNEARLDVDNRLQKLYCEVEELAVRTNTKLLKRLYNDLIEVQAHLKRMWEQN